jgi:hypothetical protein
LLTQIEGDDVGAFFGQSNCVSATLATSGAGDECDLVSQTTHAVSIPYPNRMVGAVNRVSQTIRGADVVLVSRNE